MFCVPGYKDVLDFFFPMVESTIAEILMWHGKTLIIDWKICFTLQPLNDKTYRQ